MGFIRNLFALVGLLAVIAGGAVYMKMEAAVSEFDPGAPAVYWEMAQDILKYGNAVEATVWKMEVAEGLSADEVEETMKFVANEHNIANVGELPLSKDVEAKIGGKYRYVKIFMFCNSLTARLMLDYNDAYSAYLPCRISMVEDPDGKLWLYSLNMDLMIYGGRPLPEELKAEALNVKTVILDIMQRGAEGDF
jgi:uncharacterized protein (DUF302 family)